MLGKAPILETLAASAVAAGTTTYAVIEGIPLENLDGPAVIVVVGLLVITDKLVWHTRLKEERADRQHWQAVALQSLGVAEKVVDSAEVTNDVLQAIPVPRGPATKGGPT